jgi:hypothetical protein
MGGACRDRLESLARNPQGNRPLGKHRNGCEDNIKVGPKEMGCQDRPQWRTLMNTVMNLWVPYKQEGLLTIWVAVSCFLVWRLHFVAFLAFPGFENVEYCLHVVLWILTVWLERVCDVTEFGEDRAWCWPETSLICLLQPKFYSRCRVYKRNSCA